MRLRTAALLAAAGAFTAGTVTPAGAGVPEPAAAVSWSPDLAAGEPAGIVVDAGTARLDPPRTHLEPDPDGATVPTGLLTLPAHTLDVPTDLVETAVEGEVPGGSTATVDVRGLRAGGRWTEWIPAGTGGAATLPEPASQVQGRLVLTGTASAEPLVRALALTARPAAAGAEGAQDAGATPAPLNYRVFATREGLAGGTTANGHTIAERDHFVALPSRRALAPRGTSDYSVKVCAPNGRCAFAPVWDVGPWNTRDDYWNPPEQRQEWADLPQGLPQAQAAHAEGYNGGRDQFDRRVANPAGIDLGDGLFWDALGLTDNAWVTVDYLWTGQARLFDVGSGGPVDVLAAPDIAADVVGVAADLAAVPVECVQVDGARRWLRVGADQYLDAAAVPTATDLPSCTEPAAPAPAPAPVPVAVPEASTGSAVRGPSGGEVGGAATG